MICEKCKKQIKSYRTLKQNRALHLYFKQLAEELNENGVEFRGFIKADMPWSETMIKEILWKPLQGVYLKERSTTKLTTKGINDIYDILNKIIIERTNGQVYVAFPSEELIKK